MSNLSLSSVFRAYSFLGILSVKVHQNRFKTSMFFAVFNALKVPAVQIFTMFLIINPGLRLKIIKDHNAVKARYSKLSLNLMFLTSQLIQITTLLITLLHFMRRKKIESFLNDVAELSLDEKSASKFKKRWRKQFALSLSLFFIISGVQFVTKVNFSPVPVFCFAILVYPYMVIMSFLSFLKAFELLFFVCLKDFKHALRTYLNKSTFDFKSYHDLMTKHQKMFELCESFNKVFGLQVTMATCCVTTMTVFQVI